MQELIEQFLIRSFVDGLIALAAFEVPSCLLEPVFIGCGRMLLLGLQQRGYSAGSGGFFSTAFPGGRSGSGVGAVSCAHSS